MEDCLFCKIINDEIDSLKIFEDEKVKVVLDAFPDSPGHTLILVKEHYKDLDDIPLELLTHVMSVAKKIKKLLEEKLPTESIILIQNNGETEKIKHYHLHLIPKYKEKQYLSKEDVHKILTN